MKTQIIIDFTAQSFPAPVHCENNVYSCHIMVINSSYYSQNCCEIASRHEYTVNTQLFYNNMNSQYHTVSVVKNIRYDFLCIYVCFVHKLCAHWSVIQYMLLAIPCWMQKRKGKPLLPIGSNLCSANGTVGSQESKSPLCKNGSIPEASREALSYACVCFGGTDSCALRKCPPCTTL